MYMLKYMSKGNQFQAFDNSIDFQFCYTIKIQRNYTKNAYLFNLLIKIPFRWQNTAINLPNFKTC